MAGAACDAPRPVESDSSAIVVDDPSVVAGFVLAETLRCARCHVDAPAAPEAARLHEAGARLQPAYLAASLRHELHAPGIPMEEKEAADLVQFLAHLGARIEIVPFEVDVARLEAGRQL